MDGGAIKFVLAGADIMCPGLTSEGATMHDEVCSTWPCSPLVRLLVRFERQGVAICAQCDSKSIPVHMCCVDLHLAHGATGTCAWRTQAPAWHCIARTCHSHFEACSMPQGTASCQSRSSCVQADTGDPVSIYAQDKENALAVGVMMMGTEEVRTVNKGHGVENLHYLTDGLWHTRKIS